MILKAVLRAQPFRSLGTISFIVNLLLNTDSFQSYLFSFHTCFQPFYFKNCKFRRYLTLSG